MQIRLGWSFQTSQMLSDEELQEAFSRVNRGRAWCVSELHEDPMDDRSVRWMKCVRHCSQSRMGVSVYSRGRSVYNTRIISDRFPDDQPSVWPHRTTIDDLNDDLLILIIEFFSVDMLMEISSYNVNQWTAPIEKAMPRIFQLHFPRLGVDVDTLWNAHGVWPEEFGHGPFKDRPRTFSLTRHFRSMVRLSISTTTFSDKEHVADQWAEEGNYSWHVTPDDCVERLRNRTEGRWYIHVCYVCERTFKCVPDETGFAMMDGPLDGDDGSFDVPCDCLKRNVRKSFLEGGVPGLKRPFTSRKYYNTALTACSNECYWSLRENLELLNNQKYSVHCGQNGWPAFYSRDLEVRPTYDGENYPPYQPHTF